MKYRSLMRVIITALVLTVAATGCYWVAGRYLHLEPQEYKVDVEKNVMVVMRDGIHLATDIYKPRGMGGPLPVVLCRLPYNKNNIGMVGKLLAQRGYVFVVQDCRACFSSEGDVFIPMVYEKQDGMDTVNWIAGQPWFNGKLGTWGPSYLGITQWAVMPDNPYLKATYPQITTGNLNESVFHGGAFNYRLSTGWSSAVGKQHESADDKKAKSGSEDTEMLKMILPSTKKDKEIELKGGLYNLPLEPEIKIEWEDVARYSIEDLAVKLGFAEKGGQAGTDAVEKMITLLNYPAFAEYNDSFNFKDRYNQVNAPALMVSGWFDIFQKPQLEDFNNMRKMAQGDAAKYTRIIIGPWGHVSGKHPDAGKGAEITDMVKLFMNFAWFDRWLKGEQNGVENGAPLRIFVMGKNEWRDENEWPLARTRYTNYYFRGQGHANTLKGDGGLSTDAPAAEPADKFTYDPANPVMTIGGNNLLESVGAKEQKEIEVRDDVLIFTTEPMKSDLEVTGPLKAFIWAATSAVDTDFTVKLCDVYPDGKSLNIADGIIRARYRDSLIKPSLLEPNKIYKYEVDLWNTSICFKKGHRIRLQVSSSNFPHYDRNSNAGGEGGPEHYVVANQTFYHDKEHPSHIILPVIP